MKFLADAQLPRRFADWLTEAGHDAVHTLDLPLQNRTPDDELVAIATQDGRIVVTKDDDFVQVFLVRGNPGCCWYRLAISATLSLSLWCKPTLLLLRPLFLANALSNLRVTP